MPHNFTYEQLRILLDLADYIETVEQAKFNMSRYSTSPDMELAETCDFPMTKMDMMNEMTDCGTSGCLLGHLPSVSHVFEKSRTEDWGEYSQRLLGLSGASLYGRLTWEWLFDFNWKEIDNTPQGAAWRIYWLIGRDGYPDFFDVKPFASFWPNDVISDYELARVQLPNDRLRDEALVTLHKMRHAR